MLHRLCNTESHRYIFETFRKLRKEIQGL